MYYPIIDKLKEIMADLTSVKNKEPLIIEGTLTSQTGGTWQGTYSDILNALSNKRPVYFYVSVPGANVLTPIIIGTQEYATSGNFPFNVAGTIHTTYGILTAGNIFTLSLE